jgi:hypothetical protein
MKALFSSLFVIVFLGFLFLEAEASESDRENIYLKDGTIIKGVVIESDKETIKVETSYGILTIEKEKIERIEYGETKTRPRAETKKVQIVPRKDPILAGFFSFFITGLGQIYNGEIKDGVGQLLGRIGCTVW